MNIVLEPKKFLLLTSALPYGTKLISKYFANLPNAGYSWVVINAFESGHKDSK